MVVETLKAKSSGSYGHPVKMIISELIDYPEIDYDDNAELLHHLATQAYNAVAENIEKKDELPQTIFQFKATIAEKIYQQMKSPENFILHQSDYKAKSILPFQKIEPWNFSALINFGYKDYREVVPPAVVPKLVFRGFEKACHFEYKFDSKTELDLSFVLENDANVLKWLRPAPNQFRMYWDNNSKKYEPDFVVETADAIYMVETKASNELNNDDVLQKTAAALTYCKNATEFTSQNGGKPWQYLLIPHTAVSKTVSFNFLIGNYREV